MTKKKSKQSLEPTSNSFTNETNNHLKKEIIDSILVQQREEIQALKLELSETFKKEINKETNTSQIKRGFYMAFGSLILSILCSIFLGVLSLNTWVSYDKVSISGIVQDDNADPIANARITGEGLNEPFTTNEEGFYTVEVKVPTKQNYVILNANTEEYALKSYLMERDEDDFKRPYTFNMLLSDSNLDPNQYYDYSYFDY